VAIRTRKVASEVEIRDTARRLSRKLWTTGRAGQQAPLLVAEREAGTWASLRLRLDLRDVDTGRIRCRVVAFHRSRADRPEGLVASGDPGGLRGCASRLRERRVRAAVGLRVTSTWRVLGTPHSARSRATSTCRSRARRRVAQAQAALKNDVEAVCISRNQPDRSPSRGVLVGVRTRRERTRASRVEPPQAAPRATRVRLATPQVR